MEWSTAWQLAGEVCDLLHEDEIETTARQHERIANLLSTRDGNRFDTHNQLWTPGGDAGRVAQMDNMIVHAQRANSDETPALLIDVFKQAKAKIDALSAPYADTQAKAKAALLAWLAGSGQRSVKTNTGSAYIAEDAELVSYNTDALDALCASSDEIKRLLAPHRVTKERKGALTIR